MHSPRRKSRNPGRRDGFHYNCSAFLCPVNVDGFRWDSVRTTAAVDTHDDADRPDVVVDLQDATDAPRPSRQEVAIMDIARHAKPKGVAKEFEVVNAPRRTIVSDEDAFLDGAHFVWEDSESEWEEVDEFELGTAGPSGCRSQYDSDDADYMLARRLQDEENAKYVRGQRGPHNVSGTRHKAYADVLRQDVAVIER
ncbi:hypothetical protein DFH07DRAFT_455252 [Mycena maculata]|uniref:Uncharacterized protein n=1 Tax=Mycena maculata TaxID=230809 RepID=A0AAD7NFV0_9AGAR|nr:hypothetical protein DFH07DRAFT_455252 [Mycena maculata]